MLTLKFRSRLWLYPGPGGWHFITLPTRGVGRIRSLAKTGRPGWGAVPVNATIGKSAWKTSIFPDRKSNSYLLPVKAEVRKREGIGDGDMISLTIEVLV